MTREQAREIILNTAFIGRSQEDIDTAIEMAAKALEQEPILDKLRAEITTLQNRCYALTKGTMCAFCKYECEYKAESKEQKNEAKD